MHSILEEENLVESLIQSNLEMEMSYEEVMTKARESEMDIMN